MAERVLGHRTINDENFADGQFKTLAQTLHDSIALEVQNDPNPLTSFANFNSSLNANTTVGFGTSPGLFPRMDGRASYHENVLSAPPPVFSNPQITGADAFGATVCQPHFFCRRNRFFARNFAQPDDRCFGFKEL